MANKNVLDVLFKNTKFSLAEKLDQKPIEPLIGKRLAALRDKMWFIIETGDGECISCDGYMFFSFDTVYGKRLVVVHHHSNLLTLDNSNFTSRFLMYYKITEDEPLCSLGMAFPGFGFLDCVEKLFSIDVNRDNKVEVDTYNECKYKQLYEERQRKYEVLQTYRDKLAQQFQTEY